MGIGCAIMNSSVICLSGNPPICMVVNAFIKGNLWVSEIVITYDGRPVNALTIMESRDDKVAHETYYFGDPFEPHEWRSQ